MNWVQVYSAGHLFAESPFTLGRSFLSPLLIVRVSSIGAQPSWSEAGTLFPILDVPNVGVTEGMGRRAYLRAKVLKFENLGLPFELKFRSVGHLSNVSLTIWEPDPVSEQDLRLDRIERDIEGIFQTLELIARRDVPTTYDFQ
jgi:hypothetical protein